MKAIVVYESHWGNTAAIARAIAEGLGPEARALTTAEATGEAVAGADLKGHRLERGARPGGEVTGGARSDMLE